MKRAFDRKNIEIRRGVKRTLPLFPPNLTKKRKIVEMVYIEYLDRFEERRNTVTDRVIEFL